MLTASCAAEVSPLDVADHDTFLANTDDIEGPLVHKPHNFRHRSAGVEGNQGFSDVPSGKALGEHSPQILNGGGVPVHGRLPILFAVAIDCPLRHPEMLICVTPSPANSANPFASLR